MIRKCSSRRWCRLYIGIAVACVAAAPAWAQFETRATLAVPGEGFGIAAGDFNGDGKLDIAIMDGQLSVLLGNGDGTFQKPVNYQGTIGFSVAAADFNGDGKLDLITANGYNSVSVFLGNGDGTFRSPKTSATTANCSFVAVGNFNGDHNLDIVIVNSPYVSVLLGNGDGTFQAPIDNESFIGPEQVAVGDFNNDHLLDVVVVGSFGANSGAGVLLGNGNGTMQDSIPYPLSYTPNSVATADFNRDGNLDAVVGDKGNGIEILLGNGNGSFQPAEVYGTPGGYGQVQTADLNRDGVVDVAFTSIEPAGVSVLLGNGDGTFQPAQFYVAGKLLWSLVAGDFNGDGLPDMVLSDRTFGAITLLNTGVAAFSPTSPLVFPAQLINTASRPLSVTLTNEGTTIVSIGSIKVSGEFRVTSSCDRSVAPKGDCMIEATFLPSSAGLHKGLITLLDSASSRPQVIEVSGSGTAVKVSPTSLEFGTEKVGGKSAAKVVKVTNVGSAPMSFSSVSIAGKDGEDFSETNSCVGHSIAAHGECEVSVLFVPTITGGRSGTLYITPAGTVAPQPIALSGTGD